MGKARSIAAFGLVAALSAAGGVPARAASRIAPVKRTTGTLALTRRAAAAWQRLNRGVQNRGTSAGAVVAAPRGNVEYQFHWTRDAAIAMNEVALRMQAHPPGPIRGALVAKLKRYVAFSEKAASADAAAGRGEPKYHLDGKPYVDPWGRPQNDGPALRALSLLGFADWSLQNGDAGYVRQHLYDAGVPHATGQLIKADLDYVAAHRDDTSYDVWEEVRGHHYYTCAVQASALARGARLAERLGDTARADRYRAAAAELRQRLDLHWDARYDLIRATRGQEAGIEHKWTGLDTAVILAANHTAGADSPIDLLDGRLLSTAALLEVDFRNKYPINKPGSVGFWAGRYPEDRYTGQPHQDREDGGNPWIVTTHAFAEFHFRVAAALAKAPSFEITSQNRRFVLAALGEHASARHLPIGTRLVAGDKRLVDLTRAVLRKGDHMLRAVQERVGTGPQHEQLDRASGAGVGAEELTWNYASLLSAVRARDEARAALGVAAPSTAHLRGFSMR